MSDTLLREFLITLPLLLASLVLHELGHGWVAWKLGDPTAKLQGRLSLNPLRQLDTWGSAMLFLTFFGSGGQFFFGWAKPVPISPGYFKDPQRGMMVVGAAGPLANAAVAAAAAGVAWLVYPSASELVLNVLNLTFILNVILAAFNLVPIPPLDGSRIVGGLLPAQAYRQWASLDRYGNYVMLGLVALIVAAPGVFDATIGAVLRAAYRVLPWG
jgi:Zn-dependent protease